MYDICGSMHVVPLRNVKKEKDLKVLEGASQQISTRANNQSRASTNRKNGVNKLPLAKRMMAWQCHNTFFIGVATPRRRRHNPHRTDLIETPIMNASRNVLLRRRMLPQGHRSLHLHVVSSTIDASDMKTWVSRFLLCCCCHIAAIYAIDILFLTTYYSRQSTLQFTSNTQAKPKHLCCSRHGKTNTFTITVRATFGKRHSAVTEQYWSGPSRISSYDRVYDSEKCRWWWWCESRHCTWNDRPYCTNTIDMIIISNESWRFGSLVVHEKSW